MVQLNDGHLTGKTKSHGRGGIRMKDFDKVAMRCVGFGGYSTAWCWVSSVRLGKWRVLWFVQLVFYF